MGVYRYTLRKDVREIDGQTIGRMAFAYKQSIWNEGGAYARRVAQTEAAAERARDDRPNLRYVILGDWVDAGKGTDATNVFEIGTDRCCWTDTTTLGPVIGQLVRAGRSLRFIPIEA